LALKLSVKDIKKSYKVPVIRNISLEVSTGEVVGLLGPNGAGKTTCFYVIIGLVRPDRGRVMLGDEDITDLPMYKRARMGLGYLPQESSIFRGLTVEQNIYGVLEVIEPDIERRNCILDELLADFSLEHLRDAMPVFLSGGERRRVEIARALASCPKFIMLDEPFAGIDPVSIYEIRSLIMRLRSKGIGILITDHNVRETLDMVDRVYILNDGCVLTEGAAQDVISNDEVRRVFLGERFSM
jgi:lipopolysaccharide export system ATP-binding protein